MQCANKISRNAGLYCLCAIVLVGCEHGAPPAAKLTPAVTVSKPVERVVTDYEDFTGRTEAVDSVQVRARVTGYLEKVSFMDGADVKRDDVLYQIDPRPYKAQIDQDQADLVNKKAVVTKTEAVFRRTLALVRSGASTQEDVDNQRADWEVAKAAVGQGEAKVRSTQLNVDWTNVKSPISGQLSRTLVTPGNLVIADQTLLTSIVSLDPIYAYFDVDEQTMLRVNQLIREGKVPSGRDLGTKIPVLLRLANESEYKHEGTVDFVNSRVDPSTGTLQIRGIFANPKVGGGVRIFTPGMFVRVRVQVGFPKKALLVSERAVATDQGLKFIFTVNDKNEVERREVKVGSQQFGLEVIEGGLKPDERVIVSGLQRVRAGQVVEPKAVEMMSLVAKKP